MPAIFQQPLELNNIHIQQEEVLYALQQQLQFEHFFVLFINLCSDFNRTAKQNTNQGNYKLIKN